MTTKAWLDGREVDLRALKRIFTSGDLQVLSDTDSGAYFMTAAAIDSPSDLTRRHDVAEELLLRANGLARIEDSNYRPVTLSGRYTSPDRQDVFVRAVQLDVSVDLSATAVVRGPDGKVKDDSPPSEWPDRLRLADTSTHVAQVLAIMARGETLDWIALYKVHELISREIAPTALGATRSQDSAFTASANRYDVSGDGARHAVDSNQQPPKRTMTVEEGRAYISDLARRWLSVASAGSGSSSR